MDNVTLVILHVNYSARYNPVYLVDSHIYIQQVLLFVNIPRAVVGISIRSKILSLLF